MSDEISPQMKMGAAFDNYFSLSVILKADIRALLMKSAATSIGVAISFVQVAHFLKATHIVFAKCVRFA